METGDHNSEVMRWVWSALASVSGAVTALSFRPFRKLSGTEIVLALFVGASFAMFVAPWVVRIMFGKDPIDIQIVGAVFYLMASGSNILVPFAIKKIGVNLGYRDEEPKP